MESIINLWNECDRLCQSAIAVGAVLVVYLLIRWVVLHRVERLAIRTTNDLDDRLVDFIKQFLWLIALFVAALLVLRINDIEITPLLAGAGIVGIAVGLAARELLADVLSGVFLIADRPIRVGDRVKIESIGRHWGGWGDVVDIGLRRTRIRNTDGVVVNYPNSLLSNSVITNFSSEEKPMRVRIRFQVGYDADLDLTRKVAIEAIYSVPEVIRDSATIVVRSLWDDAQGHLMAGVLVEGRYRIEDVRKRTVVRSEVLERLLKALQQNGIPMASQPVQVTQGD
ncbi:MAG: mechanosensitive ion channel family protein [Planctomycetes bacterium]|nr:mechanosensitive ion channel family protein [Planctomycetota bacterium]MBL7044593.1 mechanosensitive ion channel family protein [Pirellulaceae bacterium]